MSRSICLKKKKKKMKTNVRGFTVLVLGRMLVLGIHALQRYHPVLLPSQSHFNCVGHPTPARPHLKSTKSVPKSTNSNSSSAEARRRKSRAKATGNNTGREGEGTLTTILPMLRFSVDHRFLKWVPDPIAGFTSDAGVLVKDQGQSSSLDLMLVRLVGGDGDVMRGEGKSTGAEMLVVEELENL
jgi:hypothetical protein